MFIVALAVPERWSVEEIGSPQDVEDFQISDPDSGLRAITVNLRARQLGAFKLPFKLTAEGSIGEEKVILSPLFVTGTQQDQGLFGVAAPRSIDLKTVTATGLSSVEQQELVSAGIMSQVSAEAGEPLAYRYSKNSLTEKATVELELREMLTEYGFPGDDTPIIKGSSLQALESDSTDIDASEYKSILELMQSVDSYIPAPEREKDKPFMMPIEDVFSIKGRGTVVTGRIERGTVNLQDPVELIGLQEESKKSVVTGVEICLLYTSPSPRDGLLSRMPSSA